MLVKCPVLTKNVQTKHEFSIIPNNPLPETFDKRGTKAGLDQVRLVLPVPMDQLGS